MSVFVCYDFYLFHTISVYNKIPRAAVVIVAHRSNATITQPPIFPSLSSVFHCRIVSVIADNAITPIVAATTIIKNPICCLTISFRYLKSSCCGWMMSDRFFLAAQRRRLVFLVPAFFSRSLMMQVRASCSASFSLP